MTSANEKKSVVDASSGERCPDWDPRNAEVQIDQIRAYDHMRETCPVAYSDYLGWSLFQHADIMQVLTDHETFSNVVSWHPSVPNGMDPPQHTVYRRMIDPYFTQGFAAAAVCFLCHQALRLASAPPDVLFAGIIDHHLRTITQTGEARDRKSLYIERSAWGASSGKIK